MNTQLKEQGHKLQDITMHIWFKQNFIQTKDTVNYCVLINKFLELMGDELIQLEYIFEECNNNKSFGYYFKMTIDFRTDIKQTKKTIFTVPHQQRKHSSGYHISKENNLHGTTENKRNGASWANMVLIISESKTHNRSRSSKE